MIFLTHRFGATQQIYASLCNYLAVVGNADGKNEKIHRWPCVANARTPIAETKETRAAARKKLIISFLFSAAKFGYFLRLNDAQWRRFTLTTRTSIWKAFAGDGSGEGKMDVYKMIQIIQNDPRSANVRVKKKWFIRVYFYSNLMAHQWRRRRVRRRRESEKTKM